MSAHSKTENRHTTEPAPKPKRAEAGCKRPRSAPAPHQPRLGPPPPHHPASRDQRSRSPTPGHTCPATAPATATAPAPAPRLLRPWPAPAAQPHPRASRTCGPYRPAVRPRPIPLRPGNVAHGSQHRPEARTPARPPAGARHAARGTRHAARGTRHAAERNALLHRFATLAREDAAADQREERRCRPELRRQSAPTPRPTALPRRRAPAQRHRVRLPARPSRDPTQTEPEAAAQPDPEPTHRRGHQTAGAEPSRAIPPIELCRQLSWDCTRDEISSKWSRSSRSST